MALPADPAELAGAWQLARVIEDRLAGERTRVTGTLTLTATAPGELRWEEAGLWSRAAGVVEVRRDLLVRSEPDGWWVLFADGRRFHPWTPGVDVVHPCGRDTYRGTVSGTPERWQVRWDAHGPAKDYTMTSVLTPAR